MPCCTAYINVRCVIVLMQLFICDTTGEEMPVSCLLLLMCSGSIVLNYCSVPCSV